MHRSTIYGLTIKVDINGLRGLRDRHRCGRRKLTTQEQEEQWVCLQVCQGLEGAQVGGPGQPDFKVIQKILKKRGFSCRTVMKSRTLHRQ